MSCLFGKKNYWDETVFVTINVEISFLTLRSNGLQ
jgi:hypothetical protein